MMIQIFFLNFALIKRNKTSFHDETEINHSNGDTFRMSRNVPNVPQGHTPSGFCRKCS